MKKGLRNGLVRGFKGLCCVAVAVAITLTGIQIPMFGGQGSSTVKVAEAASTTGRVPMWAYMKSGSGKLTTYTTNTLKNATGYIGPGDYCKILAFYSNGSVKVTYPTAKGSRTAYAAMSGFMASTNFTAKTRTLGKGLTAYRRSTGSASIGTVYASDQVIVVGTANGRTQVQYPCSGGYKLGWVAGTYPANTGSNPQGCVDSVTSPSVGKITVAGWAFDRDSLGSNLQIHVYVGGPAGSGAPGYVITANAYRPDVNKAYPGVGNNHGFNSTISVSRKGTQTVYIYAINVGGGTTNPLLGTKSVNIKGASSIPAAPASNSQALGAPVPAGCKFNMKTWDGSWYGFHDINRGVSKGTPVYAIADGTVTYKQAYTNYSSGKKLTSYGNFIEFRSSNGVYTAKYCHLNGFAGAAKQVLSSSLTYRASGSSGTYNCGSRSVRKGEVIGYIGTTGNSGGVHLHFELRRNGTRIDPTSVIAGLY